MANDFFAVAIGASAGGVDALLHVAAALPANFPAAVLVTQHIGNLPSMLPELMRSRGPNPALHPADGDWALPGAIYVAPPDRHLLLKDGRIRLGRGPKENYSRPAIDPMFRSVATAMRARAIGVVLTGRLEDGTAGLAAIKRCGGTAIVQDPAAAFEPEMPLSALSNVDVDLCLDLREIVPALERIVAGRTQGAPHARARALREREWLLRRLARVARAHGDHAQADAGERKADELARTIEPGDRSA